MTAGTPAPDELTPFLPDCRGTETYTSAEAIDDNDLVIGGTGSQTASESGEKRVSWVELYFDLVLVFAITQVASYLHHDPTWHGVLHSLVLFTPIYWCWVGTSIYGNTHDVDRPGERLGIFGIGLCALLMALAVPAALESSSRALLYGLAYLAVRIVLLIMVGPGRRRIPGPYTSALCVSAPLLILGSAFHGHARLLLWGMACVVDLSSPRVFRRRLLMLQIEPSHLPERYGLFMLIALGESLVTVWVRASAHPQLDAPVIFALVACFVLSCAMWWTYFAFGASAIHHAIQIAPVRNDMIRRVLTYAHVSFILSIVGVAVGLSDVVTEPTRHLAAGPNTLLFGGIALYLLTFGYTRWQMFRLVSVTRIPTGLLCLALLPLGKHLSAEWAVGLLALVLTALNVAEHFRVKAAGSL